MSDAQSNRAAMPTVAAIVDELRAHGVDVKVIWAEENGRQVGKRPTNENVFDIPANYGMTTAKAKK